LNYSELLDYAKNKKFKKIIVSGSQRSGTTFLSKALAEDLCYKYVDEVRSMDQFEYTPNFSVSQAPCMSSLLHKITYHGSLVIFLARNCIDVIKSADKLFLKRHGCNWNNFEEGEVAEKKIIKRNCAEFYDKNIHSSYLKQNFWLTYQMHNMQVDYLTISYEKLKDSEKFIENRENFKFKQTKLKKSM
jgi:peptide subunit release factor 1 (eRF1)